MTNGDTESVIIEYSPKLRTKQSSSLLLKWGIAEKSTNNPFIYYWLKKGPGLDIGFRYQDPVLFQYNQVAGPDGAAFEHTGEDALARHDAIADLVVNGAVLVTFFANLGDFEQDRPGVKLGADG